MSKNFWRPQIVSPRSSSSYRADPLWLRLIRSILPRQAEPEVTIRPRTAAVGEALTGYEYIELFKNGRCPDCAGRLLQGPKGGASVNVACYSCGSEFNITPSLSIGERNSTRGSPNHTRLQEIFGITLEEVRIPDI